MPSGVVVIVSHLHQAKRAVVVGPHPLHRIDHAGLHGGIHLAPGYAHRRAAGGVKHLAGQTGNPHLEPLKVGAGIETDIKPARHLHTGAATRKGHDSEGRIELSPQLKPAPIVEPAVGLLRGHAKRHSRVENGRGYLALPVIGRAVASLRHPSRDGIKDFKSGHDLASTKDLDA